ncbi:MAG TPA: adenosine deaminase [Chloroflexi bacterium]|nr:adenosine deaminase [Chloroflexota bacterium]
MHAKARRSLDFYTALPKVDLHRHLEGSVRLSTLIEIGHIHEINLVGTEHLRPLVQVGEDEPYTFENFLSKFATLRLFYRSPDVIGRITREAIEDAAIDNIRYLELRFTPVALSKAEDFPLGEVMDWVIDGAQKGEAESGVKTRLIASINRHESLELAEKVARLAVERKDRGIVGLDLAGSEATAPAAPFIGIFREARQAGLDITIHAGEWGGPENVHQAIEDFKTQRVGHGVRVMEDPHTVALAQERGTTFEVCITSNYQSGVIPVLATHPFARMLSADLNVTLNTDDPSISQIILSQEYRLANEELGIPLSILRDQTLAAARAAMLPDSERADLVEMLTAGYQKIASTL